MTAIYGCWRGHSTKREAADRDSVKATCACDTCLELAPLFTVLDEPRTKHPGWRVASNTPPTTGTEEVGK